MQSFHTPLSQEHPHNDGTTEGISEKKTLVAQSVSTEYI